MKSTRYIVPLVLTALTVAVVVAAWHQNARRSAKPGPAPSAQAQAAARLEPGADAAAPLPRPPVQKLTLPIISLHGTWRLWLAGGEPTSGLPYSPQHEQRILGAPPGGEAGLDARVPGTVDEALTEADLLPSPYTGGKRLHLWVGDKEWWLYKEELAPHDWQGRSVRLELGDVRGDIAAWINGVELRRRPGPDVAFDVPPDAFAWAQQPKAKPAPIWLALRLRAKGQAEPVQKLRPLGILGHARLRSFRYCSVDSVRVWCDNIGPKRATLRVRSLLRNQTDRDITCDVRVSVRPLGGQGRKVYTAGATIVPANGAVSVTAVCTIENPLLWWPHGLGPRSFYNVKVVAAAGDMELSSAAVDAAIRQFAPAPHTDPAQPYGSRFVANQEKPIEIIGSVWTRTDAVIPPSPSDYERLLDLAASADINAFYVVGGVEARIFYDLCDEMGILVFQRIDLDLPQDPSESSLGALDAAANTISRLVNHPCIVMWCLGEPTPQTVVDVRIQDAIRQLHQRADSSRPFVAVGDERSPLVLWTATRTEDKTYWHRTAVALATAPLALCRPDSLSRLLPQRALPTPDEATPAQAKVIQASRSYAPNDELADQAAVSRLDQCLGLERQMAWIASARSQAAGIIVGRFNQTCPDIAAGLAQWDGSPMPALYWLKRHWHNIAIFADLQGQQQDALVLRCGQALAADIYIANPTPTAYKSLIATANLVTPENKLIDSAAARIDSPPQSKRWVMRFEPRVPNDCREELLLLRLSLRDRGGRTLASSTQWFGVSPNFESPKTLMVRVVTDQVEQARKRWGFLDKHGIALDIVKAPPPPPPPQPLTPTDDLVQPDTQMAPERAPDDPFQDNAIEAAPTPQDPPATDADPQQAADTAPNASAQADTSQTPPQAKAAKPEPRVVIFDAASCSDKMLADIASLVESGIGALVVRTPSNASPLVPVDLSTEERFDYGAPPRARIPTHPVVANVDLTALAANDGYYRYALREGATVIADRGDQRPMVVETYWRQGRVIYLARNLAMPNGQLGEPLRRLVLNAIGYVAKLPYPEVVKLQTARSEAAYRGIHQLDEAKLELVVQAITADAAAPPELPPQARVAKEPSLADVLPPRTRAARAQVRAILTNVSAVDALLCELNVAGLPESIDTHFSDNCFHLAPGESQSLVVSFGSGLALEQNEYPAVLQVTGYNVQPRGAPFTVRFGPQAPPAGPEIRQTSVNTDRVPQWDIFELAARVRAVYANPFQDVSVSASFVAPSRHTTVAAGFYDGDDTWRVRFAPNEQGRWDYQLSVRDSSGKATEDGSFTCIKSTSDGFVGLAPADPARLALSDGTGFVAIGGGCFSPWEPWATGGIGWRDYLDLHRANRMNSMRIFLYQEFHRGNHHRDKMVNLLAEGAQDRMDIKLCRRFDEFMAAARNRDVYPILAFFDHWPVKNDWNRYAYSALNGGPCMTQAELYTDAQARRQQQFFVDYVIARWGAFRNVLAWELWNECNLTNADNMAKDGPVMKWHRAMAKHVRSVDPYKHIIFTSFSSGVTDEDWLREDWNQLISYHHYAAYCGGSESGIDDDLFATFQPFRGIRKPLLLAELGYEKRRNDTSPAKRNYLRVGAWTMVFLGGNIILWDDNDFRITPQTRSDLRVLATFWEDNALAGLEPPSGPLAALNNKSLNAWVMASPNGARYALYVHNFESHSKVVRDAKVALPIKADGLHKLQWVDTRTGEAVGEEERNGQGGLMIVSVPEFTVDIAGVIVREAGD